MAGKPVVLPETFSGEGSWEDWLDHFNNVAAVNSWDGEQKLLWLKVRMTGRAQTAFKKLPDDAKGSFEAAVRALGERFEPQSNLSGSCTLPSFRRAARGRQKAGPISGKICGC